MFGSIKSFFTDIVAPIGITIASGGNPLPAAAYMGIKTGIETGSPLAGIGSAAFSYGVGSLLRPATSAATEGLGGLFGGTVAGASDVGQNIITEAGGAAFGDALTTGTVEGAFDVANKAVFDATSKGLVGNLGTTVGSAISPTVTQASLDTAGSGILGGLIDTSPVALDPTGLITDKAVNPAYIAAGGLGLQTMATPPPAPAPLTLQPPAERDFSKYDYKGPLQRGQYTYPDPEDLAYGRTSPDSYGYIGAKKGGQIKKFQMGGFSPTDPRMKPADSRASTQNVNIMSPPGGIADPAPSAGFLSTGKIDVVPPGISQMMQAGKPKTKSPKGSPVQTLKMAERAMMPQMPIPQMPQQAKGINFDQVAQNLPRKDLNVNIDQVRGFLGLAEGGNIPGMSKQAPAGATGPSSGLGVYKESPKMTETEFIDFVGNDMFKGNFIGRAVAELSGPSLYKQLDKQGAFNMAQGGEVESNKTLQENAFVIPADVVGHLGDGSSDAGAQKLQSFFGMNPQQYQAGGVMAGELQGPGGGMDDLIQTSIEGKQAAAVSPQEFVVPRDVVAKLGKGSYDQGSKKLYSLMKNVRKVKTGTTQQPSELTLGLNQLMSA